jgi:hypothetical protein
LVALGNASFHAAGDDRVAGFVSFRHASEEANVTDNSSERRPIGWWLKTADTRIEQAFEEVLESQSLSRREWQVLEPVSRTPVSEADLLQELQAFVGAQDAVDELRRRGLLTEGAAGVLTLTDAGSLAHGKAAAGVAAVRRAVSAALPGENYATLIRLLADLIEGLDRTSQSSH